MAGIEAQRRRFQSRVPIFQWVRNPLRDEKKTTKAVVEATFLPPWPRSINA